MMVVASVLSYVLKNGPRSGVPWQGLAPTGRAGAKATSPQLRRGAAWVRAESLGHDPEPGDLGVGRSKRNESYVEDR